MALATWWTNDPLPDGMTTRGLRITTAIDVALLAAINGISVDEVAARRAAGNRAYVGFMVGTPVTYGWVATKAAEIGELDLRFRLPHGDRYLWDFATVPEWQGRGLYPLLLRAILEAESATAGRFWIIHSPENLPSGAGMRKAGFTLVGRLSLDARGYLALAPTGPMERVRAGAQLLGVPIVSDALSPCWRCPTAAGDAPRCDCCTDAAWNESCDCAIRPRPSQQRTAAPEHD